MDRWKGKVAIVTGASAGIGAAIATNLVNNGLKVVGLARRMDKLEELAKNLGKNRFYPVECDVAVEKDILKAFEWTEKHLGGVDVLVNNAGVLSTGRIIDGKTEDFQRVLNINVIAMAICIREAVRSMRKRKATGHILNINSIAGHYAESIEMPFGLYPASKYAVTAMTMDVRHELVAEKLDIKITSISPGAVSTDMLLKDVALPNEIVKSMILLNSKDIADSVIHVLELPPNAQVSELTIIPHEGLTKGDPVSWRTARIVKE